MYQAPEFLLSTKILLAVLCWPYARALWYRTIIPANKLLESPDRFTNGVRNWSKSKKEEFTFVNIAVSLLSKRGSLVNPDPL